MPSALEVLLRQPGAVAGDRFQQVFLDGTKVELLPVGRVAAGDVDGLPDEQALFVTAHLWALESATAVTIIAADDPRGRRVTAALRRHRHFSPASSTPSKTVTA